MCVHEFVDMFWFYFQRMDSHSTLHGWFDMPMVVLTCFRQTPLMPVGLQSATHQSRFGGWLIVTLKAKVVKISELYSKETFVNNPYCILACFCLGLLINTCNIILQYSTPPIYINIYEYKYLYICCTGK